MIVHQIFSVKTAYAKPIQTRSQGKWETDATARPSVRAIYGVWRGSVRLVLHVQPSNRKTRRGNERSQETAGCSKRRRNIGGGMRSNRMIQKEHATQIPSPTSSKPSDSPPLPLLHNPLQYVSPPPTTPTPAQHPPTVPPHNTVPGAYAHPAPQQTPVSGLPAAATTRAKRVSVTITGDVIM